MAEDKKWKKNLGFLESIMFDPVTSGILGLGEGIMNLFGVSEKNSQIDALKDDYEKMKFSEDAMSRREARVKQIFGNLNNSMTGASQYLNGDTMRAMQNTKLATESAKATLDQRLKDEQYNMSITDKINQLEGQKAGYVPAIMSMLSGGLQGVFGATQSSMAMDQKEEENAMIRDLFGPKKTETPLTTTQNTNVPLNTNPSAMSAAQKEAMKQNEINRNQYMQNAMVLKSQLDVTNNDITQSSKTYFDRKQKQNYPIGNFLPNLNLNIPLEDTDFQGIDNNKLGFKNITENIIKEFTRQREEEFNRSDYLPNINLFSTKLSQAGAKMSNQKYKNLWGF